MLDLSLKDFMAFVAPLPQPLPKFLALIQPFHHYLWAALAFSLVVTAVTLNLVARGERRNMGFRIGIQLRRRWIADDLRS